MRFQITVTYKGQQLTLSVSTAVYLEKVVYQINTGNLKVIVYQKDGKWQSTNDKVIEQELLDKVGAAITEQIGVEQAG
ncbi:hypothetical protein [Mucilaginibacter sp. HD30]